MIGKRKDITGERFGNLTAVKKLMGRRKRQRCPTWLFLCDCGKYVRYPYDNVVYSIHQGRQSCGCLRDKYHKNKKAFLGVTNIKGTCIERIQSKKLNKNNKSGVRGVFWDKTRKMWHAKIMFKRKEYDLGRYKYKSHAVKKRKEAEKLLYEPFLEWCTKKYGQKRKSVSNASIF